jgi:glycosyltransferase involved in cell wall biosynthesis
MPPTGILIHSDSPALNTGLARIARHLADLLTRLPEFRVGTYGRGEAVNRRFGWMQYTWPESTGPDDTWGQRWFPQVASDFFGAEGGILFTILDPSRIHWLTRPQYLPAGPLRHFLQNRNFAVWSYLPVDHVGPTGGMTSFCEDAVRGVDRPLAYTMFGSEVLGRVLKREVEWCPHGINMDVFQPRDGRAVRAGMGLAEDSVLVGMVGTNQARKDWGLAAASIAELRKSLPTLRWWIKVDTQWRCWDIPALLKDYRLDDMAIVDTDDRPDLDLSYLYSACDLTFLATGGEGWGFPVAESLACGVPCVTTNYAGSVELVPRKEWLVDPVAWRIEGPYNNVRPVCRPEDYASTMLKVLQSNVSAEECREAICHCDWPNLFPVWSKWFLGGLAK